MPAPRVALSGLSVLFLALACSRVTDLGPELAGGGPAQGGSSQVGSIAGNSSSGTTTDLGLGGLGMEPEPARRPLPTCADCSYAECPGGKATSISGIVHTPAVTNPDPLYNAVVYLPGAALEPFSDGVSCDRCGNVSGKPVAAALSGSDGTFRLEDVPAGHDISLVVQMGRWRREVKLPEVVACQDNPLPEDLTRFPRNRTEGDIPRIALVSSPYDPEECILRKLGIEDGEFTAPTEAGRIHLYQGEGARGGPDTPSGSELWGDAKALARYDMVLLPCASTPGYVDASPDPASTAAAQQALADYADAGGRVFATDLSFAWIWGDGTPFGGVANWVPDPQYDSFLDTLDSNVDTSFPKGQALADWLQGIGATASLGKITLNETYRRSLSVNSPTQRWLYSESPDSLQSFTFNTPHSAEAAQQCGRVAYSSFHIASSNGVNSTDVFPEECDDAPLTPQERVLEFMLFDLASCVQIDTGDPKPPVIVK